MIGINVDNLDSIIKKGNSYLSSVNDKSNKLVNCINDSSNYHGGSSVDYLFDEPVKEIANIQKISRLLESYIDVLSTVKNSYKDQDQNIKIQLNHINSKL